MASSPTPKAINGLAAYQGSRFQGYAVRTSEGWTCIAAVGMSWTRLKCRTAEDARGMLRTTSHVGRFDSFMEIEQLQAIIERVPEHERPYIMPDQIPGVAIKFRLTPQM